MVRTRHVLLSALTAPAVGIGLWLAWWWAGYPAGAFARGLAGHGPDPFAWPRFVAVWVPVAHVSFVVAYRLLGTGAPRLPGSWHVVADQLALAPFVMLAGGLLALRGPGHWVDTIGLAYVTYVAAKTALFLCFLWRWLPSRPNRARALGMFLAAIVPFALLDGYLATTISTTGDEPYYLLLAHSLVHDGDVDLANNFAGRDYLPFYWGPLDDRVNMTTTPGGALYSRPHMGLQPLLLAPAYGLAGRIGALLTVSGLAAAALSAAFVLAVSLGATLRAAFLAWVGVAFCAPVLSLAGSLWPEMSAAFFTTLTAMILLRTRGGMAATAGTLACLAALFALKLRFLLAIGPLMIGFLHRVTWAAISALAAVWALVLFVAIVYDTKLTGGFFLGRQAREGLWATLGWLLGLATRPLRHYRGLLGFLLDQEHGVLFAAPILLLAVAGVVIAMAQRRWRVLLIVVGPFAAAWYVLSVLRVGGVPIWFGGFGPPGRYLASTLPLLIVMVAFALDRMPGPSAWALTGTLYAWTMGYAVIVSIWPVLRFQSGVGRATALAELWRITGLDVGRWLPTFVAPGTDWLAPALLLLAATVGVGLALTRSVGVPATGRDFALGLMIATAIAIGVAGLTWMRPSGILPAAMWTGRGGTSFRGVIPVDMGFGQQASERLVWAAQRDSTIDLAPRLPLGHYRLTFRLGAQAQSTPPLLSVRLSDRPPERVRLDAALEPAWRERDYGYEIRWPGGRIPLRLELSEVSRREPVAVAYFAHLEIVRLGP